VCACVCVCVCVCVWERERPRLPERARAYTRWHKHAHTNIPSRSVYSALRNLVALAQVCTAALRISESSLKLIHKQHAGLGFAAPNTYKKTHHNSVREAHALCTPPLLRLQLSPYQPSLLLLRCLRKFSSLSPRYPPRPSSAIWYAQQYPTRCIFKCAEFTLIKPSWHE